MFAYSFCSQARITYLLRKLATKECIDDETYGVQKMKPNQCISHCAKYTLTLEIAYTEHGVLIFVHLRLPNQGWNENPLKIGPLSAPSRAQ